MKTKIITVSVDEEVERKFRRLASVKYGNGKGYLGKAITEAMLEWERKKSSKDVISKSLQLLETGVETKKWKFNRDEIYAERFKRWK